MSQFEELAIELDKESYEWLVLNHPTIADAVEREVERGTSAEAVRAFVLRRCGVNRVEFSKRCEAAARHLLLQRRK